MKHHPRNSAKKFSKTSKKITAANVARRKVAGGPAPKAARRPVAQPKWVRERKEAVRGDKLSKAALETLEGRECLSATINLADGVLVLRADPQTASHLIVHLSHHGQQVTASINGQHQNFDLKDLKGVQMTGSAKADLLRVDHRLLLPTTLEGGAGNDRIFGGGGNDHIQTGDGNNYVNGRGGDDWIGGGAGNNTLVGGSGNDTLIGGPGKDLLYGRGGDDLIVSGSGRNTLVGGSGNDTLDGSAGNTVIHDHGGKNRIVRGAHTRYRSRRQDVVVTAPAPAPAPHVVPPSVGRGNDGGSNTQGNAGAGQISTGTGGLLAPGSDPGVLQNNGGGTPATGPTQDNGAVQPDIQFIAADGMAGHAVHVNAIASKLTVGDVLTTNYAWDFGDPGSRFNQLVGWTAGHVYDKAGTYTVTLTVTDKAGNVATTTGTVKIAADTRSRIYVDANGSDANAGTSPDTAVATVARAAQLVGDNTTVLFHNGQTFDVADSWNIENSNVTIGSYGSGAIAHLRKVVGNGSSILNVNLAASNLLVRGLVLESMWTIEKYGDQRMGARGIFVAGSNFAVRDCQFYNLDDAISTAGATGVIVQDNYFGTSIRCNCIWGEGFDHVYIGNTMTNSTQEHLIRCADTGVTRLLIENNSFYRPDNNKGSIELRTAQWFYVRGNRIEGGSLRMGLPNGYMPEKDQVAWGVVEGNETFNIFVNFRPGASHISFRDNVIHYDDGLAINVETKYAYGNRLTQDLRIDHNTLVSASQKATFLQLDGPAKDISVTNNLMVAPNLTWINGSVGAVVIADTDLTSFARISNNVWPVEPAGINQAGINYIYSTLGDYNHGFIANDKWAAYRQIHNEQYDNVDLSGDQYSVTLNGVTAGALPELFNVNAYKTAVRKAA